MVWPKNLFVSQPDSSLKFQRLVCEFIVVFVVVFFFASIEELQTKRIAFEQKLRQIVDLIFFFFPLRKKSKRFVISVSSKTVWNFSMHKHMHIRLKFIRYTYM